MRLESGAVLRGFAGLRIHGEAGDAFRSQHSGQKNTGFSVRENSASPPFAGLFGCLVGEADLALLVGPGNGQVTELQCAGGLRSQSVIHADYTFQYPDAGLLAWPQMQVRDRVLMPEGAGYRALVMHGVEALDIAIARKIAAFVAAGLPLVIIGNPPSRTPGWADQSWADTEVQATMQRLQTTLDNINKITANQSMQQLPQDMQKTLRELNRSMQGFQPGSAAYNKMVADMQRLDQVLRELQPVLKTLNEKSNALVFEAKDKKDPEPKRAKQ